MSGVTPEDITLDGVRWRFSEGEHDDADVRWLLTQVGRLQGLLGSHDDGHRCSCTLLDSGGIHEPPEWEQDPWCLTHPDMDYVTAEFARLSRSTTVTTVEELAELPNMTALMGVSGRPSFYYWHAASGKVIGYSGAEYVADVVLAGGPLTVVWRP